MVMPPTSEWRDSKLADPLEGAPSKASWRQIGEVRHVFTHFTLKLDVWRAEASAKARIQGEWLSHEDALAALPTVGRKAVALALGATAKRR
jgi:A/G-specific adenine glycosylase